MSQIHIDVNHDNIRNDLAIQIANLTTEKAILSEQVRVLANDKMNLESRVHELEAERSAANAAKEPSQSAMEVIDV
ncbi:hypothetical protein [Bacillus thuringiensis]|uniref:hypothetical protein n=1 Tax=Bacillus thuringiensis TaxID=1428 RepID=UPI000BEBE438|nr:hypothetical protein [Bacillus thuringiensis]PEE69414.1 hypothetical protein COM73_19200 [Bacillus thuringiensis]PET15090.1 hypothetical protein CN517_26330 [Bacillus thuringiensis]PEV88411.1 hypothetical protein CN442_20655 [Bacillus thuringiensis]PFK91033.1 hypothetical protein COJ04_21810 [Bacillus thuringiensis]